MRLCHKTSVHLLNVLLILVISAACSITPCTAQPTFPVSAIQDVVIHRTFSSDVHVERWTVEQGAATTYEPSQAGVGFVRPEDRFTPPAQLPQNDEIRLRTGDPLLLDLVATAAQGSTFLISIILDYKQVPFSLDGQYGLLHEISVENDGAFYIPMQIDISEPGAHDLIVVAFREPYTRPWDQTARDLPFGCLLSGRRTVVVLDGVDRPIQNITPDVFGKPPPTGVDFGIRVMFANMPVSSSDTTHPSRRQMPMTANGNSGGKFQYQLWLSNYDLPGDKVDYGLMRFLDYHQIDLKGKDLFVAHFDGRQEAIVDDSLILPKQPGIHELQVVYIFDPYKSVLRGEVLAPFVFSSSCLGIAVRE